MRTIIVSVSLLDRVSEGLGTAAVATREWQGISLRDVLLLGGGLLFCLVVIRFMLAGPAENVSTEPLDGPTVTDETGHGNDSVAAGTRKEGDRAAPKSVFDGARRQPGTIRSRHETGRDNR
jgi:hypothetical protein